jgi:hypothetical protein
MAHYLTRFMTRAQIGGLDHALQSILTLCAFLFLAMTSFVPLRAIRQGDPNQ